MTRRAGVLLPVSALPSKYGIGDMGPAARAWIAWLGAARQRVWQVLPITVADKTGCPYASPTGFATDPMYLSPDDLLEEGLVDAGVMPPVVSGPVDWPAVRRAREPFLRAAGQALAEAADLEAYVEEQPWVLDWARFDAIHAEHGPKWWRWPKVKPGDFDDPEVRGRIALQWGLDRQWARLRRLAKAHDVQLWGDLPFFVGSGSADVWAHPERFDIDPDGTVRSVTGVPPDAFSTTGQRWGHPHFDREFQAAEGWAWFLARARRALDQVDVLRLDHFRGFEGLWSIPGDAETAIDGQWVPGPGKDLLDRLLALAGQEHWVAEDLGVITDEVRALRDDAGLRGMAILQFAFGSGADSTHLPHAHHHHQVVYTGTHDNPTLLGWLKHATPEERHHAARYLGCREVDLFGAVQLAAWRSVADAAILPLQDVLALGPEARFNTPGTEVGNWAWRTRRAVLNPTLASSLAEQAILSGRGDGS